VNVSRGMLEFRADPESPYHNPSFQKDKTLVVYCASGGRSALSGRALQELGYKTVYNAGAFKELNEAGLETEPA
jgi:rhodanese-related sulfurtransferase